MEEIIHRALDFWRNILQPKHASVSPLRLFRSCDVGEGVYFPDENSTWRLSCLNDCSTMNCGTSTIPDEYLDDCWLSKSGINSRLSIPAGSGADDADMILFVDSVNHSCTTNVVGWGVVCQVEQELNRPIGSLINLCPYTLRMEKGQQHTYLTIVHEIAHALGFSAQQFAFMFDDNGLPLTPRNHRNLPDLDRHTSGMYNPSSITLAESKMDWMSVADSGKLSFTIIKTKHLTKLAKKHYNCQDLQGVAMETQGNTLMSRSHFEKRWVGPELMTASIGDFAVVSNFTLTYFQDTGWYKVNMSYGETLHWGARKNCTFLQTSCYEYMQLQKKAKKSISPWCDRVNEKEGKCILRNSLCCNLWNQSQPMGKSFQYFEDPHLGGIDRYTDYCPYEYELIKIADIPESMQIPNRFVYMILLPIALLLAITGVVILPLKFYVGFRRTARRVSSINTF